MSWGTQGSWAGVPGTAPGDTTEALEAPAPRPHRHPLHTVLLRPPPLGRESCRSQHRSVFSEATFLPFHHRH